ncbi:hypothetical protein RP20_CCG026680 [Aedes albopictus]|nr:hypothetical protein RP20_CCG026680 [Aedes albopictus]
MSKEEETVETADTNENSNESNSDTTSSHTKEPDYDATLETDRGKRFEFLLKQTEIFAHFMQAAPPKGSTSSPPAKAKSKSKKADKAEKKTEPAASTSGDPGE